MFRHNLMSAAAVASAAALSFSAYGSEARHATRVIEFAPAPGQFMNLSIGESPEAALGAPQTSADISDEGVVSLGAFGGYIILGFDAPVKNDPQNPYGVDFTISGNTVSQAVGAASCEPAAVMVMKDTNGNGIPDDGPWYELAGSEYWFSSTAKGVEIEYSNPLYTNAHQVPWICSDGLSGALLPVSAHTQPYYPDPFTYQGVSPQTTARSGNRILGSYTRRNPLAIYFYRPMAFGYADNHVNAPSPQNPRNPYFADQNGDVADGFDISWAIDSEGNHVELDQIDFVKIYTAGMANLGRLGEWSSEVDAVTVTEPSPEYSPQDYYLNYISLSQPSVALGSTARYEGMLFKNGIPCTGIPCSYSVSDPSVGTLDPSGNFTPLKAGKTTVTFSTLPEVAPDAVEVVVTEINGVVCTLSSRPASTAKTECIIGETIAIPVESTDNYESIVPGAVGNRYIFDKYTWKSNNREVGTVDSYGNFTALSEGIAVVSATSQSNPDYYAEVQVTVRAVPAIAPAKARITIPADAPEGNWSTTDLLRSTNRSTVLLRSAQARNGSFKCSVSCNRILYNCMESGSFSDYLDFSATHYGRLLDFSIPVEYTNPSGSIVAVDSDDSDSDTGYFTLAGIPLGGIPSQPGIYIFRRGSFTGKVAVR